MSRTVDVVVTVDLDLAGTPGVPALGAYRCVIGVHPAPWERALEPDVRADAEYAADTVTVALGEYLADVTGELDGAGVQA